ncbi:MAG: autotransporter domain-containing protein [Citromicrobium sp.]|nr:autotransporter domain-containing protein [Citromicrobium sp.]MAO97308.1 autotransporter domain-containing protein [Citromicrobium sp.]MBT46075.1 autotransporter domain-containing protein [Citromicrobium sp.]|tara:strand:+ start:9552 stop:12755 length:3204 start_codon:yes stop_codon:yes gene_type:complete
MRTTLLASTALLAIAVPAHAEDITTKRTTPVQTSTVKNNTPDSITITSTGSVVVSSGTAVTMDSDHKVVNQGAVTIGNASNATGILAVSGTTGEINNSGTITIDEPYTPTDTDNDGDLDGPFALGSNRFGIRTDGTHAGAITNTGTITVEGNDSAGIWLGGAQTGKVRNDGTIKVVGDRTTGLYAQAVTGDVRVAGSISAQGEDAVGVHFAGDVTGAMDIQGTISSTGYRYTTVPSDPSKLDADDLLQGGSAVLIEGDVTGGIVFAIPPANNNASNNDEDGDGIEDAKEGIAKITSYGAAPAVVIGAAGRDIAIGPVQSTAAKFGVQIDGTIVGAGLYTGVDANGLVIGGQGGAVTVANGIGITGGVGATSRDADATALRLGAGASVPKIQNAGGIEAKSGATANSTAIAVKVNTGAQLGTIANSGLIKATVGEGGSATAILDSSGTVTLIENSGGIEASGAKADSDRNLAIDLTANTTGATIKQTVVASGKTAPSIKGDIRLGTGSDTLDLADGTFEGDAFFGAGANSYTLSGDAWQYGNATFGAGNDTMSLSGSSLFSGTADFGGGADTLTIAGTAYFTGALANSGSLAVNLTGGALDLASPTSLGSLSVGANGLLVATLDKDAGAGSLYDVAGAASFADGAKLGIKLANVDDAEGSYLVLEAGSLTGAADLELATGAMPFLFKADFGTPANANQIVIDIVKRTATELGLNRSETSAYDAIFSALGNDDDIEQVFLGISDGDVFRSTVSRMLPDHAGGTFEGISLGSRAFARQLADPPSPVYSIGGVDIILSSALWSSDKDAGETAAYDLGGFGFSAAGEVDTKLGAFGLSATWMWNEYDQLGGDQSANSDTYELGAYWRGHWGGFTAFGRGSIGKVDADGWRLFRYTLDGKDVERQIQGDWGGTLMTASAGMAYEIGGSGAFFARPAVSADYVSLDEDGYTETGGSEALNLTVEDRKSDEFAVNGGMTVGINFTGNGPRDENWFRTEVEGGWREVVGGELGSTTASFEGGTPFTLDPEQRSNGWFARLRALGGSDMFEMSGEVGAEDRNDKTALTLRGSLRLAF